VVPPNSSSRRKFRAGNGTGAAIARVLKAMAELTSGFLPGKNAFLLLKGRWGSSRIASAGGAFENFALE
jgi:hypothetical protein